MLVALGFQTFNEVEENKGAGDIKDIKVIRCVQYVKAFRGVKSVKAVGFSSMLIIEASRGHR